MDKPEYKFRAKQYKENSRTTKWGIYEETKGMWIITGKKSEASALRAFHEPGKNIDS